MGYSFMSSGFSFIVCLSGRMNAKSQSRKSAIRMRSSAEKLSRLNLFAKDCGFIPKNAAKSVLFLFRSCNIPLILLDTPNVKPFLFVCKTIIHLFEYKVNIFVKKIIKKVYKKVLTTYSISCIIYSTTKIFTRNCERGN